MEITAAGYEDLHRLETLADKVWEPTYRHLVRQAHILLMQERMHTVQAYREQMSEGHRFFKAEQDGVLLGFISFYPQEQLMKVPKLYVDNQLQRRGVGKALLDRVEQEARKQGLSWLELNVNRYNKALYFYRRNGFFIYKSVDIPYDQYWLQDYVMRKAV